MSNSDRYITQAPSKAAERFFFGLGFLMFASYGIILYLAIAQDEHVPKSTYLYALIPSLMGVAPGIYYWRKRQAREKKRESFLKALHDASQENATN